MQQTIDETNRRREKQLAYNETHGITPKQIVRTRSNSLVAGSDSSGSEITRTSRIYTESDSHITLAADPIVQYMSKEQLRKSIERTRKQMGEAAKKLEFIQAAQYRDELLKLEELFKEKFDS